MASGQKFSALLPRRLFHQLPISMPGLTVWIRTTLGSFLFASGLARLLLGEGKSAGWLIEFLVYREAIEKPNSEGLIRGHGPQGDPGRCRWSTLNKGVPVVHWWCHLDL